MNPIEEAAADHVIVGAGSADCVIADRLTADGRSSVAVIETGGNGSVSNLVEILRRRSPSIGIWV